MPPRKLTLLSLPAYNNFSHKEAKIASFLIDSKISRVETETDIYIGGGCCCFVLKTHNLKFTILTI